VGVWGVIAGFLVLSFYSVIGGETIAYIPLALDGSFDNATKETTAALLADLESNPERLALYHGIFMALTALVVASGVASGIERAVTILMPLLFVLLIVLAIYAATIGDFGRAFRFFFEVDFSKLTPGMVLSAIGLGFFSIGVGVGLMVTYASYAAKDISLNQIAIATITADTIASFLAGFAMFPIVFGFGLQPDAGGGLMFETLPVAFAQMPGGGVVGAAFFLLLFVSALASAMSILELVVAWAVERGVNRPTAALLIGCLCWFVGLATVFSFGEWKDFHPLAGVPVLGNLKPFLILDYVTSNVMLPIGGILIALFVGYAVKRSTIFAELGWRGGAVATVWLWLIRIVAPLIILAIMISSIAGSISGGE
jgi:NSS family neurotransmitter:Na+ symporter